MKKILPIVIALAVMAVSCKKKSNPKDDNLDELFKLEYSNLSTEQHKEKLENAGIDFIKKINTLPDEKFVNVLSYLSELKPNLESSSTTAVLGIARASSKKDVKGIFRASTSSVETLKLSDHYGIYSWNSNTEKWVETASTSKLEFRFPSDANTATNNAVLTFTYVASNVKRTDGATAYELPASIAGILKVDNKVEMTYTSSYVYKSDGTPTKVDMNVMLGSFSFKAYVNNTTSNFSSGFSFFKRTETLIALKTSFNGNLSFTKIEESEDISDIVRNANATFEIMNIKLAGQVDIKAISEEMDKADQLSDSLRNIAEAAAWNKHAKFAAINTTDNTIMARAEFVSVSEPYCYTAWNQNGPYDICESDFHLEPRLIFKDNSKLSFDAFIEGGFTQLIDELDEFGEKFK